MPTLPWNIYLGWSVAMTLDEWKTIDCLLHELCLKAHQEQACKGGFANQTGKCIRLSASTSRCVRELAMVFKTI